MSNNVFRDLQTVEIGGFSNLQSAEIAAGMLRDHGIPCEVTNSTIASVIPMTDTWASLRLLVPASYASRARTLLSEACDL